MKTHFYKKCIFLPAAFFLLAANLLAQPSLDGPQTIGNDAVTGAVYSTDAGQTGYVWYVSGAGTITGPTTSNEITVTWSGQTGQQFVSVAYDGSSTATLIINYRPFPEAIDPGIIPKYVDPLPHFAAGLRVNAKKGGNLVVQARNTSQIALSTGTPIGTEGRFIGDGLSPTVGLGNYAGYTISYNGGPFGPVNWPAQTIEARQGYPLKVKYENFLIGSYDQFNILADQTLMQNGFTIDEYPLRLTKPYTGPIPMVVHLHGGEMPSGSDGGPGAWFMPEGTPQGVNRFGPTYQINQSGISTYPNKQEATTLWYHPHDDGLTRINVYTGLAGYYFLRGADEESAKLPGWSKDDLVLEAPRNPGGPVSPLSAKPYLPEVEIAIQDRMFNVKGELYWPVDPPNPEIHPFWTPEFVGDIMTVNGKTYPYLSVAPRKYRFRMLEGCNARFLDMWLVNAQGGAPGPVINVIGAEGGLLKTPVPLDPARSESLLMAPGQRFDVIIDFSPYPAGTTFTLMNKANAPYPDGDQVDENTSQIMQFVVNGSMVSAVSPTLPGTDKSQLPANLRPVTPLIALSDFNGNLSAGVTPVKTRQIVLNEVSADGGPAAVLVNNTYFEANLAIFGDPYQFAGVPTELPVEGTTELLQIINISADAHPIHTHLVQMQLVSRQALNVGDIGLGGYMDTYANAFTGFDPSQFPAGLGYPGGAGTPLPYTDVNTDGAIGGNPPVSSFLTGPVIPPNPEEKGWKDDIIVLPGQVTTFVVRIAPTDRKINAGPLKLLFPFDPSLGPGYVWHCHIVDHEDMSMMRPLMIQPSPLRFPQIILQPQNLTKCIGAYFAQFNVIALSETKITYQWQISTNNGVDWSDLKNVAPYSGTTTLLLRINGVKAALNNNKYRCKLTNIDGTTISNAALLKVIDCRFVNSAAVKSADADTIGSITENPAAELKLEAFPNPAESVTTVTYDVPTDGKVQIGIYNAMGSLVKTIVNEIRSAGSYSVDVSLASLSKGTYFLKLTHSGSNPNTVVMTLIRN